MKDPYVEVRFEDLPSGGSVWVRTQNRYRIDPGDLYNDEWLCVWSTDNSVQGDRRSILDTDFIKRTNPGSPIKVPYGDDYLMPIGEQLASAPDPLVGEGVRHDGP